MMNKVVCFIFFEEAKEKSGQASENKLVLIT